MGFNGGRSVVIDIGAITMAGLYGYWVGGLIGSIIIMFPLVGIFIALEIYVVKQNTYLQEFVQRIDK